MKDCCANINNGSPPPKGVHIFLGYFFILNYCLGTGFLGVPYSFYYSGYLAAIPTLLLTAFLTWLTSVWLLEVIARAQALESFRVDNEVSDSDEKGTDDDVSPPSIDSEKQLPVFEITMARKFETTELSEIFVGKWFKYLYLFILVIYGFLSCWSFSSVAGSAWSTNIPYDFGSMKLCQSTAFHHQILPNDGCLFSYYFSVFLYAIIVVTLSLIDLKEQIIVQVSMGLLRYITIAAILIYCVVKLIEGGSECDMYESIINATTYNETRPTDNYFNGTISDEEIVFKFDVKGWLLSIPVFVFAFMLHSGVSALTHPIRQKAYLHWMLTINFVTTMIALLALGIVAPLWFNASVQETITLNWVTYTRSGNSPQLRAFSYFIILFPSLDVISAYPLTIHCVVNNFYMIITGHDTSLPSKWRFDWLLRFVLRLTAAILPLLASLGVANLIYILKYAGIIGFAVCFLFPTVLQLRSIYICITTFSKSLSSDQSIKMSTIKKPHHTASESSEEKNKAVDSSGTSSVESKEDSPLLKNDLLMSDKRRFYMTPYSNTVLSHPIVVSIIGFIEGVLFVLAFASLFVSPNVVTCLYNIVL